LHPARGKREGGPASRTLVRYVHRLGKGVQSESAVGARVAVH
jgi:hypothetical protein